MDNNPRELALRKAAALILSELYRMTFTSRRKMLALAKEAGMHLDEFLDELRRRLSSVGVILREVKSEGRSRNEIVYVGVIDPSIDLDIGWLSPIDAAVLALIYMKSNKNNEASLDDVYKEIIRIVNSEEEGRKILEKSLKALEQRKLLEYNPDRRVIRMKPLGIALLPSKKELDKIIIEILTSTR